MPKNEVGSHIRYRINQAPKFQYKKKKMRHVGHLQGLY